MRRLMIVWMGLLSHAVHFSYGVHISNYGDAGQGSLREAIHQINQNSSSQIGGDNVVTFSLLADEEHFIQLRSGPLHLTQRPILRVIDGNVTIEENGFSGSEGFTKDGPGTLTLMEQSTHQGSIIIKEGTLSIIEDNFLGEETAPLILDGGAIQYSGWGDFKSSRPLILQKERSQIFVGYNHFSESGHTIELLETISGDGSLVKEGGDTLILSGKNTYKGGTIISNGHLIINSDDALGDKQGPIIFDRRGILEWGSSNVLLNEERELIIQDYGCLNINNYTVVLKNRISGTGHFRKEGQGILQLTKENQIGQEIGVNIDKGIFDLNNFSQSIGNLSGGSHAQIHLGSGNLTIQQTREAPFSGVISGTGDLIKNGPGKLIFYNMNLYTGRTIINEGTLECQRSGIPVSSELHVGRAGTFCLNYFDDQVLPGVTGEGEVHLMAGTLIFDTPTGEAYDFKGRMHGEGDLVKKGSGLQKMTCSLNGNLEVEEGSLIIKGLIGKDRSSYITVKRDGELFMGSRIKGNVSVAGTFGSHVEESTLEVDGDVTFESGSTLQIAINAQDAFCLNILGTFTVPPEGLNVRIKDLDEGQALDNKYAVLKASAFNGVSVEKLHILQEDFDNVIYSFSLNQASHELYLHSHSKDLSSSPFLTQKGPSFKEGSSFENVKNYVTYIKETHKVHPDLNRLVTVLDSQSPDKQEAAYQKVTPAINSTLRQVTAQAAQLASNQILAHQRYNQFFGSNGLKGSTQRFRSQSALGETKNKNHRLMIERLGGFDGPQAYQFSESASFKSAVDPMGLPAQEMPMGEDQKSEGLKRFLTLLGQIRSYYQTHEKISLWIQPSYQKHENTLRPIMTYSMDDAEKIQLDGGTGGIIGGTDCWIKPNVLIGVSLSGAWNELKWWNKKRTSTGSSRNHMVSGSVYGTFLIKGFSLEGNVSVTRTVYKSNRSYTIDDVGSFRANQTHKSMSGGIDLKGGYGLNYGHHFIEPYVRLGYRCEAEPAYKETGNNGLTFAVKDHTAHSTRFEAGIWGIHNTHPLGWDIAPSYQISFVHKNPGKRGNGLSAGLAHYAGRFETQGWAGDRNFLNAGVGFVLGTEKGLGASFNYYAELSSHGKTHNFLMTMRVRI